MIIDSSGISLEVNILGGVFFPKLHKTICTRSSALIAQPYKLISRNILSTSIAFSPRCSARRPCMINLLKASWNKRSSAATYPHAYKAAGNEGAWI